MKTPLSELKIKAAEQMDELLDRLKDAEKERDCTWGELQRLAKADEKAQFVMSELLKMATGWKNHKIDAVRLCGQAVLDEYTNADIDLEPDTADEPPPWAKFELVPAEISLRCKACGDMFVGVKRIEDELCPSCESDGSDQEVSE